MKFNSLRTTTLVFHELFLPSVSILNTITESLKSGKGCDGFCKAIDRRGIFLDRRTIATSCRTNS
jgi:hypothetical protein